ncbi:hypothetical protein BK005_01910 [bacterium CG10_37_50]|uniref:DUF4878 domain-containing protein n=1 Tax=Candidatus Campbellbacteria bacterium CG22_combo_CG10-13_8_21_14_all_36_13 TaxID=1974529 RepID=A0A2H0DZZ6_9BACT|nr:MAG: hypothetical protein BK005_01910 [bacterium CG10_37_50]PIP87458.1 MAG: hypothetical protein COW81_00075 [Candidatus Campbellbacteria bacterium CG22_combo_CG10-13_8_21_14_all_36_13]
MKTASNFWNSQPNKNKAFVIIVAGLVVASTFYSGLFQKSSAVRAFEKATTHRIVGNCDAFVQYVASDTDVWRQRCVSEKERHLRVLPIKEFEVLRSQYERQSGKAFLQVELTREKESYVVNYEMIKMGSGWKIANEIK